jgi:hypothetical protein
MGVYTIYFNSLDEELDRHDITGILLKVALKK